MDAAGLSFGNRGSLYSEDRRLDMLSRSKMSYSCRAAVA